MRALLTGLLIGGLALSCMAGEPVVSRNNIVMGGSTLGLRNATQQDIELTFNAVLKELLTSSGTGISVVVFESTEELYAAFDHGKVDGIFGTAVEYLGREHKLGKEAMSLKYKNAEMKQRLLLVVRNNIGVSRLGDLKNRRLTLAKYQDVETIYLNTLLLKNKLPEIPGFFAEQRDAKNPNIAMMDVFFEKSDATIIRESEFQTAVELNPQIGKKLIVLAQSPLYLPTLGGVKKEVRGDNLNDLVKALGKITSTEKGRKLLGISQASSIESISLDEVQSVRDLLAEYQSLKNQRDRAAVVPGVTRRSKDDLHAR